MTTKQLANRGFLIHALGTILYLVGIIAGLPILALTGDYPNVIRFREEYPTVVVIYNILELGNRGLTLYIMIVAVLLLGSAWGVNKLEEGWKMMKEAERLRREGRP